MAAGVVPFFSPSLTFRSDPVQRSIQRVFSLPVDGDNNLAWFKDGKQVKIRLASIDCPEKGQPYSKAAKKYTAKLAAGKVVTIWPTDTDRYGRTIAFVFVGSKDLNKELLKAGLAWHYKKYSRDPELAKLEFEAKSKKVGLWKEPNQIAPWEWRKNKRSDKRKYEFSGGISSIIEQKKTCNSYTRFLITFLSSSMVA